MEKNIQTNKITCPPRSLRRPGGRSVMCVQGRCGMAGQRDGGKDSAESRVGFIEYFCMNGPKAH
jgi:hypothetical protein